MVFSCFAVYLRIIMHGLYHILLVVYGPHTRLKIWYNLCMIIPRRYTAKQLKTIYYSLILLYWADCHKWLLSQSVSQNISANFRTIFANLNYIQFADLFLEICQTFQENGIYAIWIVWQNNLVCQNILYSLLSSPFHKLTLQLVLHVQLIHNSPQITPHLAIALKVQEVSIRCPLLHFPL